jgi:hypothetical protein
MTKRACIVIGNGPSLKDVPLEYLNSMPSFGSNRIYLLDDFTPTYYACVNPLMIEQIYEDINAMECELKFIRFSHAHLVDDCMVLAITNRPRFSAVPLMVNEGWTVTYVMLQIAYHLGFERVYLVGVDHRYDIKKKPGTEIVATEPDTNHFSDKYFDNGFKFHAPGLKHSEEFYSVAETIYRQNGREIINLTPNSALDVFEKGEPPWLA